MLLIQDVVSGGRIKEKELEREEHAINPAQELLNEELSLGRERRS
jgi:hypothetical protein